MPKLLLFPNKELRAYVIARHVRAAGYRGVLSFTCGNAAAALRKSGLDVLEIGKKGSLTPNHWFTPAEIHAIWPDYFDATPGHLPLPLMVEVGQQFANFLDLNKSNAAARSIKHYVPTGSGESILCLHFAYPKNTFVAVYDNSNQATTRDNDAPLNSVVDGLFAVEYWHNQLDLR